MNLNHFYMLSTDSIRLKSSQNLDGGEIKN